MGTSAKRVFAVLQYSIMAELASLIQKYLSTSANPRRLNFYTLLGLDELLDDRTAIATAVESAIEKLKAADRKADPTGFEQVVKAVRQARSTLLDEAKKQAYDAHLKSVLAKSASKNPDEEKPVSESVRLSALLPKGDPSAPFSMSEFLKRPLDNMEQETAAERHLALAQWANPQSNIADSGAGMPSSVIGTNSHSPVLAIPGVERNVSGHNAGRELQEMIRRNRQRKNLVASGIAVGGSLVVVSIGAWMFFASQSNVRKQSQLGSIRSSLSESIQSSAASSNDSRTSQPSFTPSSETPRMNLGVVPQTTNERVGELPKFSFDPDPPTEPNATEKSPVPDTMTPTPDTMIKSPEAVTNVPEPPPKEITAAGDIVAWQAAMTDARKAIEVGDFKKFSTDIERARGLSASPVQEEQGRRLDKYGQLTEISAEKVKESMNDLQGQAEIRFGSTGKALVVEKKSTEIILRISGKNETHAFDKLPMGIVLAIVESKLTDSARDQAIRGILCTTDPRSNAATKKNAKEYFDKAAALDASFAKLDQIMTESF
ncbi:MAG: hypothetical protein SGI77_12000 [Pirellulaceae bacterium]|nr:hypothetical protein [Pirellulaceae bacterium]